MLPNNKLEYYSILVHCVDVVLILAALKLCERDYRVITQGLKIGTIRNVITKGQPQTLQNIVNKTNVKVYYLKIRGWKK